MIPILVRAGARYHLRHRWQLALALLGVTLGVAVVVAVDVATGSARRAYDLSTEATAGRATHEILGGPNGISDSTYVRLRNALPAGVAAAPAIDRFVRIPDHGRAVRLLGLDPFAESPFRSFLDIGPASDSYSDDDPGGQVADQRADADLPDIGTLLTRRALIVTHSTALDLGLTVGDSLTIAFGTTTGFAFVASIVDPVGDLAQRALADVVIADISTAQEITGSLGSIDRIDVRIERDYAESARRLEAALPPGLRLIESGARAGATARLTRAFDTNLTALALVALVFGMFLIYNSMSFSVVQRRPLLGMLRALGVTERELFSQIVLEAAVLGMVATLLGLLLGSVLGSLLLGLVTRTVNDLYFVVSVTSLELQSFTVMKAALLGMGATIAAAVPPALEAVRTPPRASLARAVLERRTTRRAPRSALIGAMCVALAGLVLMIPSQSVALGFASLFILVLAGALITPAATILLMHVIRPAAAQLGVVGRMAARGVTGSLSRTAPAIAALAVALSVGIAVTLMIASFRNGVIGWLEQSLQADLYVAAPAAGANRADVTLAPALGDDIAAVAGVAGTSTYRQLSLLLEPDQVRTEADLVRIIAFDPYEQHRGAFEMIDASASRAWAAFDRGDVLISEPLAYRRDLAAGDTIALPTDRGDASFAIAGVFRDYSSEHGVIFIPRTAYDVAWNDRDLTSLAVFVSPGADVDVVLGRIRALESAAGIIISPTRSLREATLQVFDRTFLITGVLRLLALIVAFVGVTGALMALQLERAREIGVLRTAGLTPLQVWSLITSQTALMGMSAAVLALPLGTAMSWAMVHVINRRSFGWSFDLLLDPEPFLHAFAIGIGAAMLAGLYPSLRMARLRPAQALRDE